MLISIRCKIEIIIQSAPLVAMPHADWIDKITTPASRR